MMITAGGERGGEGVLPTTIIKFTRWRYRSLVTVEQEIDDVA